MMKMIEKLIITACVIFPAFLPAQDTTNIKTRSLQVGFITPLSSNGLNSWNITNKFSINLLAGYAGGIDGVEFSGLGSVLQGTMRGAQFSGLCNIVLKETKGVQFSGLLNYSPGPKVTQLSGLLNVVPGNNQGLQIGGLANITSGRLSGTQISGLFNYAGKLRGVQLGFINYADSLEKGVPIGFLSFVRNGYTAFEIGSTETLYGV
ncbi:MAG: hypothetical protein NTW16_03415, partial [Bacteroidetes bacterium]|nr:hypothetical protein [Bacteroidota bacterium]